MASLPEAIMTSRIPGTLIASAIGRFKIAEGRNSEALTTSFIHFAERMSFDISAVPA